MALTLAGKDILSFRRGAGGTTDAFYQRVGSELWSRLSLKGTNQKRAQWGTQGGQMTSTKLLNHTFIGTTLQKSYPRMTLDCLPTSCSGSYDTTHSDLNKWYLVDATDMPDDSKVRQFSVNRMFISNDVIGDLESIYDKRKAANELVAVQMCKVVEWIRELSWR